MLLALQPFESLLVDARASTWAADEPPNSRTAAEPRRRRFTQLHRRRRGHRPVAATCSVAWVRGIMKAVPGRCRLCTTFAAGVLNLMVCGVPFRRCVRHAVTRYSARSRPTGRACPSEPAGCLSDTRSSEPACTCLPVSDSRRGRPVPRGAVALQACAARTAIKNTAATCSRALATAFIVDEQGCARVLDLRDEHVRRARELGTSIIVDEQGCARAKPHARAAPVCRPTWLRARRPRSHACRGDLVLRAAPTSGCACSVMLRASPLAMRCWWPDSDLQTALVEELWGFDTSLAGALASAWGGRPGRRTMRGRRDPPPSLHTGFRRQRRVHRPVAATCSTA